MASTTSEENDLSSESSIARPAGTVRTEGLLTTRLDATAPVESTAHAAALDTAAVIVANNPLPAHDFPSNAPPAQETHLHLTTTPKVLDSPDDLRDLMAKSRATTGFSNFADLATPKNTASTPIFPTFTRFSSMRFANAELAQHEVVPTAWPLTGALYDMAYPINLTVTDSRNISLPDLPAEGILDSSGYPLLYNAELERKIIRPRSSGALYPVNMSRVLINKLDAYPDPHIIRAWAHMFQLTNEKDAQEILLQRAMGSSAGDNHIALLLKAYLAYFDSAAAALTGVEPARELFTAAGTVINVTSQDGWASQVLAAPSEIVNVLGGSTGYQEFWAYCCFDQPAIYAAKTTAAGAKAISLFSHYKIGPGMAMVCLCDVDAYSVKRQPTFFAKPNLILGYIETYVQKFGLQQQANEALQIAMLWPVLVQTQANISLPRPLHTADWLGAEIERSTAQTPYQGLIASSPFVALASTLASAWAMRSQIYDYVTLLASKRTTWKLSKQVIASTTAWLATHASAPGVGWDFLLRNQFSITPSFLYLTGLSVEVLDWSALLSSFTWKEKEFPAHLRLIQPFWVKTSVCCMLPWQEPWKPSLQMSANLLTATPLTLMRMLRLGLLDGTAEGIEKASQSEGIFAVRESNTEETVEVGKISVAQLQTVVEHGVKILALCARQRAYPADTAFGFRDPVDGSKVRKLWAFGAEEDT